MWTGNVLNVNQTQPTLGAFRWARMPRITNVKIPFCWARGFEPTEVESTPCYIKKWLEEISREVRCSQLGENKEGDHLIGPTQPERRGRPTSRMSKISVSPAPPPPPPPPPRSPRPSSPSPQKMVMRRRPVHRGWSLSPTWTLPMPSCPAVL